MPYLYFHIYIKLWILFLSKWWDYSRVSWKWLKPIELHVQKGQSVPAMLPFPLSPGVWWTGGTGSMLRVVNSNGRSHQVTWPVTSASSLSKDLWWLLDYTEFERVLIGTLMETQQEIGHFLLPKQYKRLATGPADDDRKGRNFVGN